MGIAVFIIVLSTGADPSAAWAGSFSNVESFSATASPAGVQGLGFRVQDPPHRWLPDPSPASDTGFNRALSGPPAFTGFEVEQRQPDSLLSCEPLPPMVPPVAAAQGWLVQNYYDPFSNQFAFGNRGNQPYRFDLYSYDDFTYLPTARVRGVTGSFQDLQWNAWVRFSRVVANRYIFAWTPTWNSSFWTGPSGVALPPDVDQIKSDFQLSSVQPGPWNWQLGFTPQINADFRRSLNYNAYMFDGRAVLFYQPSAEWRFAVGMAYWNRVRGMLIPYGGVVWSPDDRWEFRLFFPKSRISRYWGTVGGTHVWTYASLEYNLQAWQVEIEDASRAKTRMQMASEQLLIGASAQQSNWTAFIEGGFIFDRHVRFRGATPGFGIQDALMLRIGALY